MRNIPEEKRSHLYCEKCPKPREEIVIFHYISVFCKSLCTSLYSYGAMWATIFVIFTRLFLCFRGRVHEDIHNKWANVLTLHMTCLRVSWRNELSICLRHNDVRPQQCSFPVHHQAGHTFWDIIWTHSAKISSRNCEGWCRTTFRIPRCLGINRGKQLNRSFLVVDNTPCLWRRDREWAKDTHRDAQGLPP